MCFHSLEPLKLSVAPTPVSPFHKLPDKVLEWQDKWSIDHLSAALPQIDATHCWTKFRFVVWKLRNLLTVVVCCVLRSFLEHVGYFEAMNFSLKSLISVTFK